MALVKKRPFHQRLGSGPPGLNGAENEQPDMYTGAREEWGLVMWVAEGHCFRQSDHGLEQS